jgi:hypothetical protein
MHSIHINFDLNITLQSYNEFFILSKEFNLLYNVEFVPSKIAT